MRTTHFHEPALCGSRPFRRLAQLALALCLGVLAPGTPTRAAEPKLSGDAIPTSDGDLVIHPINHATFVMTWNGKTIYVDPVGGAERFANLPRPDLILVTDIHGDHLNAETLTAVAGSNTKLVVPAAAVRTLSERLRQQTVVLANGRSESLLGIHIEAVPMYNLTPERLNFHTKGAATVTCSRSAANASTSAATPKTSRRCAP